MSGCIAVSVSLIGLTGVIFTLGIFIQMVITFPVMLSSNSQAYVSQQRSKYNFSASRATRGRLETATAADADSSEWDCCDEEEAAVDTSVEKWVGMVEKPTTNNGSDPEEADLTTCMNTRSTPRRHSHASARRHQQELITRGRSLIRRRSGGGRRTTVVAKPLQRPKVAAAHGGPLGDVQSPKSDLVPLDADQQHHHHHPPSSTDAGPAFLPPTTDDSSKIKRCAPPGAAWRKSMKWAPS